MTRERVQLNYDQARLSRLFTGEVIRTIRTRNRDKVEPTFVEINLHAYEIPFELHANHGWKLVSAMINTVRFRPQILGTKIEYINGTCELKLVAYGFYTVASFIAVEMPDTSVETEAFRVESHYYREVDR